MPENKQNENINQNDSSWTERRRKNCEMKNSKACAKTKVLGRIRRLRKDISESTDAKILNHFPPIKKWSLLPRNITMYDLYNFLRQVSTCLTLILTRAGSDWPVIHCVTLKKNCVSSPQSTTKKERKTALSWFFFLLRIENNCCQNT